MMKYSRLNLELVDLMLVASHKESRN